MIKIFSTLFHAAKPLCWGLSLLIIFHTGIAQPSPHPLGVTVLYPASDFGIPFHFGEEPRFLLADGYKGGWGGGYEDHGFSEMPFFMQDFMLELRDNNMGPWSLLVLALLFITTLSIGITMILVGSLVMVVFVYILVKIIQAIVSGEGMGTDTAVSVETEGVVRNEADIIGKYVYYLYLVSILSPIVSLAGVILSYIHREKVSEWMKSHYRFLIRTFWIGLLYAVISGVFTIIVIGIFGYALLLVWLIVRCIKGIRLHKKGQPIPDPGTWFW